MAKNGMANYGRIGRTVNMTHMPTPRAEHVLTFPPLTGGLNLYSPDYQLNNNESPDMENLWWRDGALCSRPGQLLKLDAANGTEGVSCYSELFNGYLVAQMSDGLYYCEPDEPDEYSALYSFAGASIPHGTFIRYGDSLYFKSNGAFVKIDTGVGGLTAQAITSDSAYAPVLYINTDMATGAGNAYQPWNRIGAHHVLWYDFGTSLSVVKFSGDGSTTRFSLSSVANFCRVSEVTVNGAVRANWYLDGSALVFYAAPETGSENIDVVVTTWLQSLQIPKLLPSGYPDSIDFLRISGTAVTAFTYDSTTGVLAFTTAQTCSEALASNAIEVGVHGLYEDTYNSIMSCNIAAVYGGDQNLCMVFGGCAAQPNAYFWNGFNVAMDATYWPMEQYNLGGDTDDAVTGLIKQQGYLMILKRKSIGRADMTFTSTDISTSSGTKRMSISMNYTGINSKIGCDLPWTVQLVDNNVVFCNTEQGAHIILNTSAAYENNIQCLSTKVNGSVHRLGLLSDVRAVESDRVCSLDDEHRYWITANGKTWCWDYELSEPRNPSWFLFTETHAVGYCRDLDTVYHIRQDGSLSEMNNSGSDYGMPIKKRYQFATQMFGTYDRLKDISGLILSLRMDTDVKASIRYITDYESRKDLTDIEAAAYRLVPRNLVRRSLRPRKFALVVKRRPGCRHIRHFALLIESNELGFDMPVLSAQVFYKFSGRER